MDKNTQQKIQQAKEAGYTDQEIQDYLAMSQPTPQSQTTALNTILPMIGGGLGAVGGGFLGAGAGALVPVANLTGASEVAGGYLGGVAGAGAGAAAGNQAAITLNSILSGKGIPKGYSKQDIESNIDAAKIGAGSQAIGGPVAKGLGLIAHPIKPFIEMVDKKLASSAKKIDFSKLLNEYKDTVLPELQRQGYGQKATEAFNTLRNDITSAVGAFKPHLPGEAGMVGDITNMELPIAQANQLKRNITSNLSKYYGGDTGQIDIEARKKFGSVLKENIAQQEPGVKAPNAIASTLYKVPETTSALTSILGLGNPTAARAIQGIADLPFAAAQKVIPAGGGYLNQLIPRFMQLLGQTAKN